MKQYLVYAAGSITGCSYDSSVNWREELSNVMPPDIIVLSPLRGKTYLQDLNKIDAQYNEGNKVNTSSSTHHLRAVMSSARGIMTRDFNDCIRSDAIVVNLLGAEKVSIGTVMEIAWAKAYNIPVILIIEDGNPHDHPMVNECVGFRVSNLNDAIIMLKMLLLPMSHREDELAQQI